MLTDFLDKTYEETYDKSIDESPLPSASFRLERLAAKKRTSEGDSTVYKTPNDHPIVRSDKQGRKYIRVNCSQRQVYTFIPSSNCAADPHSLYFWDEKKPVIKMIKGKKMLF